MKDAHPPPQCDLRAPSTVMRLARMGQMMPTRLSFLRVLTRQMRTPPERTLWAMDADGFGQAVYTISFCGHSYSLVAISQALPDAARSDRVIATAWDAAFVLYDGVPETGEVERIAAQAPLQEAGRFTDRDLVLSRANKSVRLWAHVVDRLRAGAQPDWQFINDIGYLMRTTAVYGNGKFGIADRDLIADRPGLSVSFMVEMLTVWLIRHFTHDLVEHVSGGWLEADRKRHLGIGNATGLGMAPFLVSHPILLNNWMMVRETALARVRAVNHLSAGQREALEGLFARASLHLAQWQVPDARAQEDIQRLAADWQRFTPNARTCFDSASLPLDRLWREGQRQSVALQELLLSLMLEPFGALVDGLADCLTDPFGGTGRPFETVADLRAALTSRFGWALETDYAAPEHCARFWYVSEEKLEPRIGDRHNEAGAELESPLDIARRVAALYADLRGAHGSLAAFLRRHPQHLLAVERVQIAAIHPYSEIQDNLIAASCRPIDMLRAKLSLFGATKFDPKSDLWTRVTLAQGAPLAEELESGKGAEWWCPTAPL